MTQPGGFNLRNVKQAKEVADKTQGVVCAEGQTVLKAQNNVSGLLMMTKIAATHGEPAGTSQTAPPGEC